MIRFVAFPLVAGAVAWPATARLIHPDWAVYGSLAAACFVFGAIRLNALHEQEAYPNTTDVLAGIIAAFCAGALFFNPEYVGLRVHEDDVGDWIIMWLVVGLPIIATFYGLAFIAILPIFAILRRIFPFLR